MQDISLHLLDIAENSIRAKASLIRILIDEAVDRNVLMMCVEDNGIGMAPSLIRKVTDPFVTTRTTRKVGLGLPLLKQNCLQSGGTLKIDSKAGYGTTITATMKYDDIDRLPLGNIPSSLCILMQASPQTDIVYTHQYNEKKFIFDTTEIKKTLQDVPINELEIIAWLKEYLAENIEAVRTSSSDQ